MKLARKLVGPQLVLLTLLTILAATQLWVTRREQRDLETSTSRLQQEGSAHPAAGAALQRYRARPPLGLRLQGRDPGPANPF